MEQAFLTVEELLQLSVLEHATLISGAGGLRNEIRYVDVMEIPDLTGWLRPHEFVFTTGYAFQDNPDAVSKLLDEMHKVGGAAIGVKQRRFGYQVSEEARHKSEEYRLPIIDIPPELTTIDITHSVMEMILNRQFVVLSKARDINSEFLKLILHRRSTEIVVMLGNLLHCEVAVLNANGRVLNATPNFSAQEVMLRREIQAATNILGYLVLTQNLPDDDLFAQMCLDQAVTVLALEFTIQETTRYRKAHAREEFLIELLSGMARTEDILVARAQHLDFPRGPFLFILVVRPLFSSSDPLRDDLWERMRLSIVESVNSRRHLAVSFGESFVVFGTTTRNIQTEADEVAELLYARLSSLFPQVGFMFGVGCVVDRLVRLVESYDQGLHAVEAGRKVFQDRHVIHYSDIYIEDMLLSIGQHSALLMLYTSLLQPLYQYDVKNGTDLFKTLESFVRHGGNTRQVAVELYIHRNSVSYRLDRIQDILCVDLFNPEIRIRLDLLFRAWKLQLLPPTSSPS
jgi:purine catabolism regulator